MELHRKMKSEKPNELWCKGGRGSTKSTYISLYILLGLARDPLAHAFVGRRYDNELRDTVYGQMQWAAYHLRMDSEWRFMTSPMQAVHQETGQKVLFRGVDNPLKAKSINLGKGYIKYAWFEEVDQYGSMDEVRSVLQSIFRGPGDNRVALFSYNPPKSARAWVNQEVRIEKPGRIVHSSDYRTVPAEWLGERFITEAEHLRLTNPTAYEHEYLGEEIGTGLEVFNNVEARRITDEEKAGFGDICQGLDFGYALDPLAFERMYYDVKKRTLWIFEEISGVGIPNRQLAERASLDHRRTPTIADCAEPKSIDELRIDFGFKILPAVKGPGSVEHGIKWLSDLERIIVDPVMCPLAAKEFVNYALDRNKNGEVISRYPDRDNHSIDAVRYGLQQEIRAKAKPKKYDLRDLVRPTVSRWA